MEQRISLITLGVDDVARSRRFYEQGMGWEPKTSADDVVTPATRSTAGSAASPSRSTSAPKPTSMRY
nr:VOC family protein [Mycolicibacterium sp. GF69]